MPEAFIGEIRLFCGGYAPEGWALCNGQVLQISVNPALYAVIGTQFGGDGRTTFCLPDLRGRVPIHPGQGTNLSPYTLGQNGGDEKVALSVDQLPPHAHSVVPACSSAPAETSDPTGAYQANSDPNPVYSSSQNASMKLATTTTVGAGQTHKNIQPYLCINFIIALEGLFPTRP